MGWFHTAPERQHWPAALPTLARLGNDSSLQTADAAAPVLSAPVEGAVSAADARRAELAGLIQSWRARGLDIDRHGSPALLAQLEWACSHPVPTILCSVLDDEPSLRLNAAVAALWPTRVLAGLRRLLRLTGARRALIAVEADAPFEWNQPLANAAAEVVEAAAMHLPAVKIVELPNHYPQADPTLLLYTLTGRRLVPGRLPVEEGVLLLDAPAAMAIGRDDSAPTPVGILNHKTGHAIYGEVCQGMTLGAALAAAGISADGTLIFAGDWRREQVAQLGARVGSGELTINILPRRAPVIPQPCVRCGWCAEVCPTRLFPALALEAAQRNDPALARRAGAAACIGCGLCDQACPANLPILEGIRRMKVAGAGVSSAQ